MPRDWDTQSVRSDKSRNYTTVRRYKVPDPVDEDDRYETDIKITNTNREEERDVIYEREYDRRPSRNVREIKVTREMERAPSPPPVREWLVEREPARRAPYELERYSRETEYVREPERIQPIIIRQEAPAPIIIRESAPAPQEIVIREERRQEPISDRRSDENRSVANRSLVRREPSPSSEEEDYYYKRTTRQVARRNDGREEERDSYRRDVDPRDSVSQYGDRRGSDNSDEEYSYRKTTEEWGPGNDVAHKRHLAEGAAAGLGAAYLLQSRKKKQGEKAGGAGQLVGGAALGAIATEVISRVRNRSQSRGRNYRGSQRERSPEDNHSLAKVGAVAVLGALAGYAYNRSKKNNDADDDRRSRSRRRRSSVGRSGSRSASRNGDRGISGNRATIAKAGLASAAVAGLVERVRSKSQGGRSKSLARQALPAAAAGLGGAALAGLYTRNKEQKERGGGDSPPRRSRSRARSRARRRSRTRSRSAANFNDPAPGDQQNLVVYGGESIPPADQYARPRSRADSYYSDTGRRGARGSPDSSHSVSPRRESRNGQRNEGAAAAGLSGAAAAASADEGARRRERKRQERERRRMEEERNETPQGWGPYSQAAPAPLPEAPHNQYYPQTDQFPPPPHAYSPVPVAQNYNYQPYNPAEFGAQAPTPGNPQYPGPGGAGGGQWYNSSGGQQPFPGHYNVSSNSYHPGERNLDRLTEPVQQTEGERPTSRLRRKSVQFDTNHTAKDALEHGAVAVEQKSDRGRGSGRRERKTARRSLSADDANLPRRQRHRKNKNNRQGPSLSDSEETVMLPDRFDSQGRRKVERDEDPLAATLADVLNGRGEVGQFLQQFAGDLLADRRTSDH